MKKKETLEVISLCFDKDIIIQFQLMPMPRLPVDEEGTTGTAECPLTDEVLFHFHTKTYQYQSKEYII